MDGYVWGVWWFFLWLLVPMALLFTFLGWRRGPYVSRSDSLYNRSYAPWMKGYLDGPHIGKGPRNYIRSDDRISDDVNERLMMHGEIDASDILVSVINGQVTLKGVVDHRRTKRLAEEVVDSVIGVKDVQNELQVGATKSVEDQSRFKRAA